ncbi:MAG: T9SS type A sorting domain-containing protein, partial [Bacteroidia bacterium]
CLPMASFYSRASFSNRHTGELIFASNGWRLVNSDEQIVSHKLWFDNTPHPGGVDSTGVDIGAGPLFLPNPGDSTKAYLFYGQYSNYSLQNFNFVADNYFTYALLDIPTKSLISKNNIVLSDTSSIGDMQACRHANGRDWWIIKPDIYSNKYFIGLLTPLGLQMTSVTVPNAPNSIRCNTSSKFNIQGTKYIHYNGGFSRMVHEYDFDRCSGTLSNFVLHDISDSIGFLNNSLASLTISPDGSKFYIKRSTTPGILQGLFQVDLATDSMILISRYGQTPQMTPNGKNIIFPDDSLIAPNQWLTRISEISNPNAPFNELEIHKYKYTHSNVFMGVAPSNFAYMRLGADTLSICDSLSVITKRSNANEPSVLVVFPNPATNQLNLVFDKNSTGTITINDALGKEVYSYNINNPRSELPIDISNFTNGIYYVNYKNKDVSIHKKFIKQ